MPSIRSIAFGSALAVALSSPAMAQVTAPPVSLGHEASLVRFVGQTGAVSRDAPLANRTAADLTSVEAPVAGEPRDAASAAVDSSAATGTCESYFTKSQALGDMVSTAYQAMKAKDTTTMTLMLPKLDSALKAMPNAEISAEACVDHINAYTSYQYFELNTLRNHGVDIGLPQGLPIVKQPTLNHVNVAYATGWMKFEKGDFEGALAAYNKGLVMYPHEFAIQSEVLATLIQLDRYADAQALAEHILDTGFDLDDTSRGKVFGALGMSLLGQGDVPDARDMLSVSLRYDYDADVASLLTAITAPAKP